MSPKRRFLTAMMGGKPDRIPVGNVVSIVSVELMKAAGCGFPEAHLNADEMTQLAAAGHEILGYDTVMPVFSVTQEAAALGCEIDWGTTQSAPAAITHPFADAENLSIPDGWMERPSIQVVLDSLALLRKKLGEKVVIVGKAMGPWTLSYHMMGTQDFLMATLLEPDRARQSVDLLKAVTVEFARAQVRAGADVVCIADHPTREMVSPVTYRDMLLPVHQEIISQIGCPTILHCCGNSSDRIHYFAEAGFDCYHFESQVDARFAVEATAGKMTVMGNINNPEVLLRGTPRDVAQACSRAIDGSVHILSPECSVPLNTPVTNLQTLVHVAEGTYAQDAD